VRRDATLAVIFVMSLAFMTGAETCTSYPFKVAVLKARVSQSLLNNGVTRAEVFPEVEGKSAKTLVFDPGVKRVLVASANIDHGRFAFTSLAPGLYWVVLAPFAYHFAVRVRRQAAKDAERYIDEENGCTVVDFQLLK
jgi:hypothetical protein